ncbi:recombinase family protein [Amycolatopsis sp. H20-H5]|uniref:recombinase family protein n=1 Tax=Amycolatopsis sp. H20-H5 TaxID=3046309 RepID=UPI002DB954E3|nr:recombinase family protein [Amycolatopsis sp. H20-H5]MEC3974969.1 recombinase family protein [Amycolatopsis sp. H20-H5]
MTMNTNQDGVPRWAATAGRRSLAQRVAARGARLFCPSKRPPTDRDSSPTTDSADVRWAVRQRVLREYHTATLAQARRGSEELVRAGFNTGDVPYGYRAQRVEVTPTGRRARWRNRLVMEPVEAATVRMIFVWRGTDRLPTKEIRRRLAASRYPAPLHPETGQPGAWTVEVVRAILRNPKYLGRQVWGRTHHGKLTPRAAWVWSETWVHPPLITVAEFTAANRHQWLAETPPSDGDIPARGA